MQAQWAFQALGDLKWPIHDRSDPTLAREITGWFSSSLEARLRALTESAQLMPDELLTGPATIEPGSVSYCPRCRGQFVAGRTACPNGVPLQPLAR